MTLAIGEHDVATMQSPPFEIASPHLKASTARYDDKSAINRFISYRGFTPLEKI